MKREDRVRLQHMIDAAKDAMQFATGQRLSSLRTDRKTTFAVVRAVEIIGEAAGRLSSNVRVENPSVPWPALISMRNRLIHAYFDVDVEQVWSTVNEDLPTLVAQLEAIVHHQSLDDDA